jgi:uncharacterized repeat protein (TIGR03803 family)
VIRDSAGNLYGTTYYGGLQSDFNPYGYGVVYKLATTGQETVLYSFTGDRFPQFSLLNVMVLAPFETLNVTVTLLYSAIVSECLAGLVASLTTKVKANGWPASPRISSPLTAGVANTPVAA